MAAAQAARPTRQPRPTTASWDDLLGTRGQDKGRARSQPPAPGRRSHSIDQTGRTNGRPNSQVSVPVRPHSVVQYADHRTSQSLGGHGAARNGRPSPLSQEVMIGSEADVSQEPPKDASQHSNNTQQNQSAQQNQSRQATMQRPGMYTRPQRLAHGRNMSGPNAAGTASSQSFDAMLNSDGRARANSWSGMPVIQEAMSFQTFPPPHVGPRHSGAGWQRPYETVRQTRPGPNEQFDRLPSEVLNLILDHLKRLHLEEESKSCATCWMRDCCSVAMCNRGWLKIARKALYADIQLIGQDSKQSRKKWEGIYMPRLVLLRRSLRGSNELAQLVHSLKVPALPDDAPINTQKYHDLVASLVMACPHLERVCGFYPSYRYGNESRFFHAMSTRRELREMTWVIEAAPEASAEQHRAQQAARASKSRRRHSKHPSAPVAPPHTNDYMMAALANQFVTPHKRWEYLSHLTIHCLPGSSFSPPGLINATCGYLPSLKSLYLSQIPAESLDDNSLRTLPVALKKLSLHNCAGVTTTGLTNFATGAVSNELEVLTLSHQNMDSLASLVRILSRLSKLVTFNLVQAIAPTMVEDLFMFMPYLGSQSLRNLHWDILESGIPGTNGESGVTRADDILARSIAAHGFPNLRNLRVPNDPEGRFQALCKPKERMDLPGDRFRTGLVSQATTSKPSANGNGNVSSPDASNRPSPKKHSSSTHSYSGSGADLAMPSPDSPGGRRSSSETKDSGKVLSLHSRDQGSDLHQARLAAQARLESARRFPKIEASITDESGKLLASEGLAGYMGNVSSKINYRLTPDIGGVDERGGLVGLAELLEDGGEDLYGKGDTSSNSGGSFGAGTLPSIVRGRGEEPVSPTKGKLTKANTSNAKSSKVAAELTKVREGCTGRWNCGDSEGPSEKKGAKMEPWWHMERGRWRGRVELS